MRLALHRLILVLSAAVLAQSGPAAAAQPNDKSQYKLQLPSDSGVRRSGSTPPTPEPSPNRSAPGSNPGAGNFDDASHPKRRAGLWEVITLGAQAAGMPPAQYCIDEQTDRHGTHLDRDTGSRGACHHGSFKRNGPQWIAESSCREGKTSVISRSVATGDFLTHYRIDTVVSYEPPIGANRREDRTAISATWIGPCKPGQRPGDISITGMGNLNMIDGKVKGTRPVPALPKPTPRQPSFE